jgi:hypothetical protein
VKSKSIKKKAPAKAAAAPRKKATATGQVRRASAGASRQPSRKKAAPANADSTASSPTDLLRAGLSALSLPRAESAVAGGLSRIADSFGFKKLEDVFDQRVAGAMERIGYPSAAELNRLMVQLSEITRLLKSPKARK